MKKKRWIIQEIPNQNDQSNTILFSILSYIGILWLIPLLVEKNDKVVRFHVNQGIVLFIFDIIGSIAVGILSAIFVFIPVISFLGVVIASLFGILCFVLMIIGIVNAANKSEKPLPIIGKFQVLK